MNNKLINELYKTIEAKDKIINKQVLEIAKLKEQLEDCEQKGLTENGISNMYKERIDKAIEYIKENCSNYYVEKPNYRGVELINIEELLKILGDKE